MRTFVRIVGVAFLVGWPIVFVCLQLTNWSIFPIWVFWVLSALVVCGLAVLTRLARSSAITEAALTSDRLTAQRGISDAVVVEIEGVGKTSNMKLRKGIAVLTVAEDVLSVWSVKASQTPFVEFTRGGATHVVWREDHVLLVDEHQSVQIRATGNTDELKRVLAARDSN